MKTLRELLIEFNAWEEVIEWAGDKTIEQVMEECHRGDWLLRLAYKFELPERKLIACSGHCVNTVRHLIKDESSINLLDMCMNFEDESISFEELKKARAAAAVMASAADAAVYAAARACAAEAAGVDARKENQRQTANVVRERLGQDIINKVNKLLTTNN